MKEKAESLVRRGVASAVRRSILVGYVLTAAVLSISMFCAPAFAESSGDSEAVWITLGADAFELVSKRSDFSFETLQLKAEAEENGAVATRIHRRDVERLSTVLHEEFRRCGGFMAHADLEQAMEALRAGVLPEVKALPKAFEINQGAAVGLLRGRLERDRIRDTIENLSTNFNNRYYQHDSGRRASVYLRNLWRDYARNRPDVTAELYEHAGWLQPSVVLTIPGSTHPDEYVVLGGHLDSIAPGSGNPDFSAPGADDNASGMAVLSEVIRAAMVTGLRPSRTVQFMGYAAEEVGLRGSQEIANAYRQEGRNVVAVMQLDMTAFNGSVDDIVLISDFTNAQLNQFVGRLVDTYQSGLSRTSSACGYACSDHASWTAAGFPATFPHEAKFGEGNPVIHTTEDTLSRFNNNANHAIKFAHLASAFMVETAFEPATPPTAPSDLSALAAGSGIALQWTDNSTDETGFEIEQRTATGSFASIAVTEADAVDYRVESLATGTDYGFRVRAINGGGASDYSEVAEARTSGETPPADLSAVAVSATEVSLSWSDRSSGETGFLVQGKLGDGSFSDLTTAEADAQGAVVGGLEPQSDYTFRVRAVGGSGDSSFSGEAQATTFVGDPEPCDAGESTLCLNGGRFKVEVEWQVGDETGSAKVVPGSSDDSGLLWFFTADNWELLVKVLDGCGFNDRFWVFLAATTDLQYRMVVTDSWTGFRSIYTNTAGTSAPAVTDIEAFAGCAATHPDASGAPTQGADR